MQLPDSVVLHIGMSKAGSTAIQNVLDASYDSLLAQGILFPRSVLLRQDAADPIRTPGHLGLIRQLRTDKAGSELSDEIARAPGAIHTLVLSVENLFHNLPDRDLRNLRDFLGKRRVTLVALLRAQHEWCLSRYYEAVCKGFGRETADIEKFTLTRLYDGTFDYEGRLETVAAMLGPATLEIWNYDRLAEHGGVVRRFLDLIGADSQTMQSASGDVANRSFPYPEGLEAHRQLNRLSSVRRLNREDYLHWCGKMRTEYRIEAAAGNLTEGYLLPSLTIRKAMLYGLRPGNSDLAARFFGGAPFGPDRTWLDRESPAPDPAMVAKLVDRGTTLIDAVQNDKAAA